MSDARSVTIGGNPAALAGNELKVGDVAPDFKLVGNDLKAKTLEDYRGNVVIVSTILSIATGICDMETKKFNEYAADLGEDVNILTVSTDLPFGMKQWCGNSGVERVETLSDHMDASFGTAYGVLMPHLRALARCIFVIDREGVIRYIQLVKEVAQEPNYDEVLEAAKSLI